MASVNKSTNHILEEVEVEKEETGTNLIS